MRSDNESDVPGQDSDDITGHPSDSDSEYSGEINLAGTQVTDTWSEYGDTISPPQEGYFRVMCCNTGPLGSNPDTDTKMEEIRNLLENHHPNVMLMQEHGVNFRFAGVKGQWKQRLGWGEKINATTTKTIAVYNENDKVRSNFQWGGTSIISQGETTKWAAGSGKDPSGLGRWCWVRFQGTNGSFCRFVTLTAQYHTKGPKEGRKVPTRSRRSIYNPKMIQDVPDKPC